MLDTKINSTTPANKQASRKRKPRALNLLFEAGSDVEIAERMALVISEAGHELIHCEGAFWEYTSSQWRPIPPETMRKEVHVFDRKPIKGSGAIRLGRTRIDSILHELGVMCYRRDWFAGAPAGINCASGFVRFDAAGNPILEPHHPDHRQRHTLPGRWQPGADSIPPAGSLLDKLLSGCFLGDDDAAEKVRLIAEVCGCAALGHATRLKAPKAIIMHGQGAENGKSQVGHMVRGLLPADACCAITPAELGDDRKLVTLIGKLLNERNEISGAKAISAEVFKTCITGEMITARNVYEAAVSFRPVALHLYSTNKPPRFDDGIDRGVRRRLLPLVFNRTIPHEERIEDLGCRIGAEEPDALLAFAVTGASRLLAQSAYTTPASSHEALNAWVAGDVVWDWAATAVELAPYADGAVPTADAYGAFVGWALREGYAERFLPSRQRFPARLASAVPSIQYRIRHGRGYLMGMRLAGQGSPQGGAG